MTCVDDWRDAQQPDPEPAPASEPEPEPTPRFRLGRLIHNLRDIARYQP